jgi:hypothetical protein
MSSSSVTPAQRDATELLSILEFLGGEDDAKWEELRGTLSSVKTGAAEATAAAAVPEAAKEAVAEPPAAQPQDLGLVKVAPAGEKDPALGVDLSH